MQLVEMLITQLNVTWFVYLTELLLSSYASTGNKITINMTNYISQ